MRIIHFSDFHLLGGTQRTRSERIARNLIKCFMEIARERNVDLVVFSGDLVDGGGEGFGSIGEGFTAFKHIVIDPTLKALGDLPADRFIFVPGNHDFVNPDDAVKQDMADNKTKDANAVDIVLCDNTFSTTPWMKDFKDFESEYYTATGNTTYKMSPFQSTIVIDVDGEKVGIAMLNSTWRHFCKFDGKVVFGKHQVTDAVNDLDGCDLKFAVAHHHYGMLEEFERNDVRDAIISYFKIFFSGHVHSDKPMSIKNERGQLLDAITLGIIPDNEGGKSEDYKNGFFVIDYEEDRAKTFITRYEQDKVTDNFIVDTSYGENGKFSPDTYEIKAFIPINQWLASYTQDCPYMSNDKIGDIQNKILDSNIRTLQLVALSGFGKTRMIYETFSKNVPRTDTYYAVYSTNAEDAIRTEFRQFLVKYKDEHCTVIIDNCPVKFLSELDLARGGNSNVRIITLDNNIYDVTTVGSSELIEVSNDILRTEIENYIDLNIPDDAYGSHFRVEIKKISDGFPKMAIDLVNVYKENKAIGINKVESLFDKLLIYPKNKDEEMDMRLCMQAMSLFQPMPYGTHNTAYDFIRNNQILYSGNGNDIQKRQMFNRTIRRFDKRLIEIDGENLVVRPFPLAVWLAGKWFESVDETMIENLLKDITLLSENDKPAYRLLKEGLAKRLEYMAENEYASELVGNLLIGVNSFFRNEKVVCSDLGSRLFLAMSHVNPVAVGSCLWTILQGKTAEWIKEYIVGDIRRNLVWTLEKVCFPREGFIYGAKILALLSLGENENLGNNATQIFNQLFHIFLSGTAATLDDRFSIISYLKAECHKNLFANVINNAFLSGSFVRSGSAQKFGTKEQLDYQPSNGEILDYWDNCRNIVIESINDGFLSIETVKAIVEKQAHQWIFRGMFERLALPIINVITEKAPADWEGLYTIIKQNERTSILKQFSKKHPDVIESLMAKIRPDHFVTKIKDLRTRIYEIHHLNVEDETKLICDEYRKLAEDFVAMEVYADKEEIRLIDEDMEYLNYNFPHEVVSRLDDEQLHIFVDQFISIYKTNKNERVGSFYLGVARECKDRTAKDFLLTNLLESGLQKLYVCSLATMENENFDNLQRLRKDIADGKISPALLAIYINNIRNLTEQELIRLITIMSKLFPDNDDDILSLILNHRFGLDFKKPSVSLNIIKQSLLNYNVKQDNGRMNYEYNRFCCNILEKSHDEQFAVDLSRKMIDVLNTTYMSHDFEGLYSKLLLNYGDTIWHDFSKALVDEKHFYFYFNLKDEIGSGYNFGAGALFQIGYDRLKNLCNDYPAIAPKRLATMCPVFDTAKDDCFHEFFLWLLDEYGHNKDVRDNLHANANSFSWTGSVIPLYNHLRSCFNNLLAHQRKEVREWANQSIEILDKQIADEKNREAYMRLHYE